MALLPSDAVRDTHLKSLLDTVLESSKQQLTLLRTQLEEDPQKLAKKEREFIFKESAKLENIGNLQARLDEYRETNSKLKAGQKAKEALSTSSGEKLGNHLRAIGQYKPNKHWHAHHIVCSRHASHGAARFKLFAYLGINDPFNGCWLPQKHKYATGTVMPHAYVHTNKYADWVRREIRPSNSKNDLIMRLREIRLKLIDARNIPDILTKKGKQDLRTAS